MHPFQYLSRQGGNHRVTVNSTPCGGRLSQGGFSLLEMLAALGLLSVVMSMVVVFFFDVTHHSNDQQLELQANQAARALIDGLGAELRLAGNGLPLGQRDFSSLNADLGDAPLPVLIESDEDHVVFRSNTKGDVYILSSDFKPAEETTVKLVSTDGLAAGMDVYITNGPVSGSGGLKAEISSVTTDSVALQGITAAPEGSIFAVGSILDPVSEIEFNSPADWTGVQRITGDSSEILLPNSQFSIQYLDSNGAVFTPPLSAAEIAGGLSAVELTIRVRAKRRLRSGVEYVAELRRIIALRNLCFNR